ncbi:MAG: CvpA family protein [Gammaproteobacteria bacterium]|jgi:membrane protein required for colicin V production|nr:CvpA family protein [Gammaproteobacteria bacterium]
MMGFAGLDVTIACIVLLSATIGLVRGLVKEVLSLIGWIMAFAIAVYFSSTVVDYLPRGWGSDGIRLAIAFVLLFIATLIGAAIVQWLIAQLIETTGLTGTDRFLGFIFGSARGLLICLVLLIGMREIVQDRQWWQASILQKELLAFEGEVRELLGEAKDLMEDMPSPFSANLDWYVPAETFELQGHS